MILKMFSKRFLVLYAIASISIAMGCGDATSSYNDDELNSGGPSKASGITGFTDVLSGFRYPNGLESVGTVLTDDQLIAEYTQWKGWYVTESGAGDPNTTDSIKYYRVKRDKASSNDTVSEGIGYGMLLAVYFNDRETFDGLYRYCKLHFVNPADPNKYSVMHWKVRADGVNISEFRLAVPHGIPFMKISEWSLNDIDESGGPGTFKTYYLDGFEDESGITDAERGYSDKNVANRVYVYSSDPLRNITNEPGFVRAAQWDRKLGSATDADVDIAAALCMASKRWTTNQGGPSSHNYTNEAALVIKSIINTDVSTSGQLRNGTAWLDSTQCWNPSYFTPAWWRVFAKFIDTNKTNFDANYSTYLTKCNTVISFMYTSMKKIDVANGTTGLFPDWCDTSTAGVVKKAAGSDRRYYLDDDINGSVDDRNSDGTITYTTTAYPLGTMDRIVGPPAKIMYKAIYKFDNGVTADCFDKMSFNYYYDAVRVPWRLALDYSWYTNTDAKNMVQETANFFKTKITPTVTMVDGYAIDGTAWKLADRDGFNNLTPDKYGGQYNSLCYRAMNATTTMVGTDATYAQNFYNLITAPATITDGGTPPVERANHYYENCLRLLSLLYMSGKMVNYYDVDNLATFKYPRKPAQMRTVGPLTIDLAYADYGVYATTHLEFNDRAKLFNNDQTLYGKIGTGVKSGAGSDKMTLGYAAYVGDVVCGLPTLWLRDTNIRDNSVLARGGIDGRAYFPNAQIKNMNKDPGCMDFSVDASKFTPDMNQSKNVRQYEALYLVPGKYGDIKLNGQNKLYLSSGVYQINSLNAEPDCIIYLDTTSGPVQVYVKNDFSLKSRTKMLQKDSTKGADPSKILFVVNSSNGVYLAPTINWRGTLIAPNTSYLNVDMGNSGISAALSKTADPKKWETTTSGGEFYGAIIGKYVVVHQDTAVFTVPFDWASIK
jgi:hypothetical protein